MKKPKVVEVNCETGEIIERPMNDKEFEEYSKAKDEALAE